MLSYRTLWLSDIHLGIKACQAGLLLEFLRHAKSETLYLVGDIFDGWELKKKWYWPESHNDVVHDFLRRAREGTRVIYIPGNHDEMARDYLGRTFGGIQVINELIHVTADGKRLLVMHGDQFDAVMGSAPWLAKLGSAAYILTLGINWVFNTLRRALGFPYWSLAAYLKSKVKGAVKHINDYEHFLAEEARRQGCSGIVCGHIHRAEIRMIEDILYCNDGDWVESCTALVEHHDGRLEIINWPKQRDALLEATGNRQEATGK
jgi:UDP-2,3-diacylglucosamine pyrophosphatase LpxH